MTSFIRVGREEAWGTPAGRGDVVPGWYLNALTLARVSHYFDRDESDPSKWAPRCGSRHVMRWASKGGITPDVGRACLDAHPHLRWMILARPCQRCVASLVAELTKAQTGGRS